MDRTFLVARNPDPESSLPYLLRLPLEGGVVLKAREPWPHSSRVYCHPFEEPWPGDAEVLEEVPVKVCRRRGPAIDLVLDRPTRNRAQFVHTRVRARPAIFMQTRKVARKSRPGVRVPSRKASGVDELAVAIDTREKYPYKFSGRPVATDRRALPAGDYAVLDSDEVMAAVERKKDENFAGSLSDGTLNFQMAELAAFPAAAVVVEGRYSDLFKVPNVQPGWLAELLARLQVHHPSVPVVFCENRKLAEEWTYRFLAAAARDLAEGNSGPS